MPLEPCRWRDDGMDEITTTTTTQVAELNQGEIRRFVIEPTDFGIARASEEDLQGGDPDFNAQAIRALLDGEPGAFHDIVVLNAGAALVIADLVEGLADGIAKAKAAIADGRARLTLDQMIAVTAQGADA